MSKDLLETKDMLHGRQERGMEKDMIAREIKVATKKSHIWEFIYTNVKLEGKFAFSSDSVQYIKRLTTNPAWQLAEAKTTIGSGRKMPRLFIKIPTNLQNK